VLVFFDFVIAVVPFDFVPASKLRHGMDLSYGVNTPQMVSPQTAAESLSQRFQR
jgi:hypothetical protein